MLLSASPYVTATAVCLATVMPLAHSRWTWRVPVVGIVLWQTLALSLALSLVGIFLAVGLSPYGGGQLRALARYVSVIATGENPTGLTAAHTVAVLLGLGVAIGLTAVVGWHFTTITRVRRRHWSLLSLVADPDPTDPRLLHLDHPRVVAYCLPGRRSAVVVSAGALGILDREQLAAVLDHEQGHARERHDLVLLPFAALHRALPWSRLAASAYAAVSLLVEMRADDWALRRHAAECVSSALRLVSASGRLQAPEGTLGITDSQVGARLCRIAQPPRPHRVAAAVALTLAAAVVATPTSHYLMP